MRKFKGYKFMVYGRILISRIRDTVENVIAYVQSGFRRVRVVLIRFLIGMCEIFSKV